MKSFKLERSPFLSTTAAFVEILSNPVGKGVERLVLFACADQCNITTISRIAEYLNWSALETEELCESMVQSGLLVSDGVRFKTIHLLALEEKLEREHWDKSSPAKIQWVPSPNTRLRVYRRDEFRCHYCGSEDNLCVDHKKARSKGGGNELSNLVTACRSCNSAKGVKDYDEYVALIRGETAQ